MNENPQPRDLGERIASMEGELRHLATRDFVREVIETQTKELTNSIQEQTKHLEEKMQGNVDDLRKEVATVKGWQNKITGGGAALALFMSLTATVANIWVIASKLP